MFNRTVLALALVASIGHAAVLRGKTVDGERMRPEVVAATLAKVEDDWKAEAVVFTEGNDKGAPASFGRSCATVVSAVVQGSGGDRNVAKEYMSNVCGQKELAGWHKLRCNDLAVAIVDHAMTADAYANRETLNPGKLCTGFWSKFVDAERKREAQEAKERAEREAKEAKERAEREKREAEEAAIAKKKAEADAKAEAERRAKEEAERVQREKEEKAKREAAEAKARAAEAAAKLAAKKAEAEKVQKAAQEKLEEAAKAEKEHLELQAAHKKAEEVLASATKDQAAAKVASKEAKPVVEKVAVKAAQPMAKVATKSEPVAKAVAKPETAPKVVAKAEPVAKVVAKVEPVAKAEPAAKKAEEKVAKAPAKDTKK